MTFKVRNLFPVRNPEQEISKQYKIREEIIRMDLSCNETMINDVENEFKVYVEYQPDEKSTSAEDLQQQQPIAKLYSNACPDPTFLKDRCLTNLLISQKRYKTPSCEYFSTVQKTLTPQMRKIVAEWVIEVSQLTFSLLNGVVCVEE